MESDPVALKVFKVSKGAKIRNRYNQVPHLTQDTNGKVTNSQLDTTNESQEVSPFPAGDHKAHINRRVKRHSIHKSLSSLWTPFQLTSMFAIFGCGIDLLSGMILVSSLVNTDSNCLYRIVSEYDQEIPQSKNCTQPRGTVRKRRSTITRH